MSENASVASVVASIAAAFPRTPFSEATFAVWVEDLKDIPIERLLLAAKKIRSTATFCPSIGEIRKAAMEVSTDIGEKTAEEAWGVVLDTISGCGYARAPQFNDPLVERAVQCTARWYDLCTSNVEDIPSHRARFIAAYEQIHRKAVEGHLLPDSLRRQIADCRKDFIAGTLGGNSPQDYISDQAQRARALLKGFGNGGQSNE